VNYECRHSLKKEEKLILEEDQLQGAKTPSTCPLVVLKVIQVKETIAMPCVVCT
jgi:hypothetical protein